MRNKIYAKGMEIKPKSRNVKCNGVTIANCSGGQCGTKKRRKCLKTYSNISKLIKR
jgi:hypothetical protein